uniref:Transporter n=1 Tax=Amphiprion ocellaris TaxID=80972 RepID=A0AAQ5X3U7_AMPOC
MHICKRAAENITDITFHYTTALEIMTEETARGTPAGDSAPDKQPPEEGAQPREKWANKMEFVFAMAGEIIGLGNIWRFPYLCYKNGGGVFLIPYCVFLFFCGIPVFFLETALGQYTSEGGVTAWRKICPMFEGVGIASQVIVIYLNIYYIVVLAWGIFYLINSFKSPLPWSTCDNYWNTCNQISAFANPDLYRPDSNWSFLNNVTSPDYYENVTYICVCLHASLLLRHRVLRMSDDMSLSKVHWDLALCLLLAWVICYFCIWKGIKCTGKVVYFTASFPYLMLLILFIRGVTLPGASEGLSFYLTPDFSRLSDPYVWRDAGTQVFFSYAVCQGVLTALGSYNKYNNNCYRDCLTLCCLNSATSIFAGFVVFSVLGFMASNLGVSIHEVATAGPGLAFIAYPQALSMLPAPSFWAVLFFLMIIFLGLDTQFVCVESLATAITDMFPRQLRRPRAREILVLIIAIVCFLLGLLFVTEVSWMLSILKRYFIYLKRSEFNCQNCWQTIMLKVPYGADRFYHNIEDMIGYLPFPVLKYCWMFVTPLICGLTVLFNLTEERPFMVDDYIPGAWVSILGFLLVATPLICIPAYVLVLLYRDGNNMMTPSRDLRQAKPHKPLLTLYHCVVFEARVPPNRNVADRNEKMMMEEPSMA